MITLQFPNKTVSYEAFVNDVAKKVSQTILRDIKQADSTQLVSASEAASILGITPDRLRRIKDKFSYVKQGDSKQGKLLFKRSSLIKSYVS